MAKFTMLIGIQGSGKSTYTKKCHNVRILSSDLIREAVLGDRADQNHQGMVFDIMNKQAKMLLSEGYDVIYDATNISSKRRTALLKTLPEGTYKEGIFFPILLKDAIYRDKRRKDVVGEEVIKRTYNNLDIPMKHEGFDKISYFYEDYDYIGGHNSINWVIEQYLNSYDEYIKDFLSVTSELSKSIDFAQDNPHHSFSVGRHMYFTMDKAKTEDNGLLTLAAALHDCGKPFCKKFKEDGYACFYGHEKISAQIAIIAMMEFGFNSDIITHIATLINLHMRMHQEGGKDKLLKLVGKDMYKELELLHQADSTAK